MNDYMRENKIEAGSRRLLAAQPTAQVAKAGGRYHRRSRQAGTGRRPRPAGKPRKAAAHDS